MAQEFRIKAHFIPGQELAGQVAKLESRVVLNATFQFPDYLVGQIPGQSGNLVMTNRAYERAQRMVDRAIKDFAGSMARLQRRFGPDYLYNEHVQAIIGMNGFGEYSHNTLLGRLNRRMEQADTLFAYGKGLSVDPVVGTELGAGLSVMSANTGANINPAIYDPNIGGETGTSVAELLESGLFNIIDGYSDYSVHQTIEVIRVNTLQFREGDYGVGLLPTYLESYGPVGSGSFSLINR
ncbi:MAG: hypothetical protein RJA81_42 [Planctomycetota bacterium]|jgi:hypothetical protein